MTAAERFVENKVGAAAMTAPDDCPSLLVVDDDPMLRQQLGRSFQRRGYSVRLAANFDEAMAQANREPPELAVIDLKMPGRSGLDLLTELKRIDPTTKVVILTGFGSIATAVDAMRLGATNYVAKPADVDDILAAFDRGEHPVLEAPPPNIKRPAWRGPNGNTSIASSPTAAATSPKQRDD